MPTSAAEPGLTSSTARAGRLQRAAASAHERVRTNRDERCVCYGCGFILNSTGILVADFVYRYK